MIVIISKDKDFSHKLAEHIVRELEESCECTETTHDWQQWLDVGARLFITAQDMPKTTIPVLKLQLPVRLRSVLSEAKRMAKDSVIKEEIAFSKVFLYNLRTKELRFLPQSKHTHLTDKEGQLLLALLEKNTSSKEELLKNIWGFEADLNTHTLETHIYRLRSKFKDISADEMILVVDNGYELKP